MQPRIETSVSHGPRYNFVNPARRQLDWRSDGVLKCYTEVTLSRLLTDGLPFRQPFVIGAAKVLLSLPSVSRLLTVGIPFCAPFAIGGRESPPLAPVCQPLADGRYSLPSTVC